MSFFCHYNISAQFICKVGSSSLKDDEENTDIIVFEIAPTVALSLLSGDTNSNQWVAMQQQAENELSSWKLVRKDNSDPLVKNETSLLVKVPVGEFKENTDIHIILDKINNQLDFYFLIDSLQLTLERKIEFFITKAGDPSFLLNSLIIDLKELAEHSATFEGETTKHARRRFRTINLPDISIFTTKIFSRITMEILHDHT